MLHRWSAHSLHLMARIHDTLDNKLGHEHEHFCKYGTQNMYTDDVEREKPSILMNNKVMLQIKINK